MYGGFEDELAVPDGDVVREVAYLGDQREMQEVDE